jgi:putative ABC transport system permease protein
MNSYVKLALKVLGRRKLFTFISLFGISMTLVVLMVATSVLDNFFAPHGPESKFGRALVVYRITKAGPSDMESSEPGYAWLDQQVRTLPDVDEVAIFSSPQSTAVYRGATRIDTAVKRTDGAYWRIVDFRFLEGRPFTAAEDVSGAHVAVISDEVREKLFDREPALGKTVMVEGLTYRIIGVVPRVSLTRAAAFADIWVPIGTLPSSDYRSSMMGGFNGLVLAKSRSDFARLKAEYHSRLRNFPLDGKQYREVRSGLDTPFEAAARLMTRNRAGDRGPYIVMAAFATIALLFMILPALNLVTLNLSRILERAPEIGVRKAFGASRPALISQFIIENVVLTLIGGLLGFVLTIAALRVVNGIGVVPNAVFQVNVHVFIYGMLTAAFFGVLSGVYPAWRMSRLDPVNALRGGAK